MADLANRENIGNLNEQITVWANSVANRPGIQVRTFIAGAMRFQVTATVQDGEILSVEHD